MGDITDVDQLRPSSRVNIFSYQNRVAGTYTQLLNMSGYKSLIYEVMVTYGTPPTVSTVSADPSIIITGPLSNMVDQNLSTSTDFSAGVISGTTYTSVYKFDFGTSASRIAAVSFSLTGPGSNGGVTLTVSNDDITYVASTGSLQTFRYVKASVLLSTSSISSTTVHTIVNEVYDSNTFGGSLATTLEIFEYQTSTWMTYLTLNGGSTNSIASITSLLPNTSTDLRFKVIQTGNISNWGISAILVQ